MGEILLLTGGLFFVFCLGCVVVNHVLLLFIPRNVLGGLYLCLGLLELSPDIAILSRPGYTPGLIFYADAGAAPFRRAQSARASES